MMHQVSTIRILRLPYDKLERQYDANVYKDRNITHNKYTWKTMKTSLRHMQYENAWQNLFPLPARRVADIADKLA